MQEVASLAEAPELRERERLGGRPVRHASLEARLAVEQLERLPGRHGPEGRTEGDPGQGLQLAPAVAGAAGVLEGAAGGRGQRLEANQHGLGRDLGEGEGGQRSVVPGRLDRGPGAFDEVEQRGRRGRLHVEAELLVLHPRDQRARLVALRSSLLGQPSRRAHRVLEPAAGEQDVRQRDAEVHVERPRQGGRPAEQAARGAGVGTGERAAAGGGQAPARLLAEGAGPLVHRPQLRAVAVRLLEVVADELVLLDQPGTALLQPAPEALVQLGPRRLRQRLVGGVPDEQVAEPVRVVPCDRRRLRTDQLLAHERGESGLQVALAGQEDVERAAVEHPTLDGSALEHRPLGRIELVEPGCQQGLDRRWHLDRRAARLAQHREHLLDEERNALRGGADALPQAGVQPRRAAQPLDQLVGLGRGERLQEQRGGVELASGPGGAYVQELGTAHAEEQEGRAPREVGHVLDEVEERLLAPVHVVEEAEERLGGGGRLERLAHRPGDLLAGRGRLLLAEQRPDQLARPRSQLELRPAGQLLQHLDDGPVGDPLPVGKAAAAEDAGAAHPAGELLREPGLAHARGAEQGDQVAGPLGRAALPRVEQQPQLPLAADELPVQPPGRRLVAHRQQPVGGDRLLLAAQRERLHPLHVGGAAHEPRGRLAEQDLVRLRCLLQAGGDVDRVPGRQPLLGAGDDLPGVDPGAQAERDAVVALELLVQPGERGADSGGRAQRAQRVVLVRDRDAEHRHHRVPDELLHRAAVALDLGPDRLEVAGEHVAQALGVEPLPERRRAGHVAEEDGDDLALLSRGGHRFQPRAAGVAEARAGAIVRSAGRAGGHGVTVDTGGHGGNEAAQESSVRRSASSQRRRSSASSAASPAGS